MEDYLIRNFTKKIDEKASNNKAKIKQNKSLKKDKKLKNKEDSSNTNLEEDI